MRKMDDDSPLAGIQEIKITGPALTEAVADVLSDYFDADDRLATRFTKDEALHVGSLVAAAVQDIRPLQES